MRRQNIRLLFLDTAWKCYQYTVEEDAQITNEDENREMCERHDGFIWTRGDDSKAPGCGTCWCCQPDGNIKICLNIFMFVRLVIDVRIYIG